MDPISIALMGGGLISGLLGQRSQAKQAKKQYNAQLQQWETENDLAEKLNRQGLATQVDAQGNVTYYDEVSNTWKTVLAEDTQKIQDASNLEQLRQYSIDAPLARDQLLANAKRQVQEDSVADTLRRQIENNVSGRSGYKANDLAGSLTASRMNAVNQGFDQVQSALTTQALRSGAGGIGAIGGQLAKQRAQAIAQTMGNPTIEGIQLAEGFNGGKLNTLTGAYNTFAQRAQGNPMSYNPTNVGQLANAPLAAARAAAASGGANQANIVRSNGPMPVAPVGPNYMSQIFASLGDLQDGGAFDKLSNPFANRNKTKQASINQMFADSF